MNDTLVASALLSGFIIVTCSWDIYLKLDGDSTGFRQDLAPLISGAMFLIGLVYIARKQYIFGIAYLTFAVLHAIAHNRRGGGGEGTTQSAGSLLGRLFPW